MKTVGTLSVLINIELSEAPIGVPYIEPSDNPVGVPDYPPSV